MFSTVLSPITSTLRVTPRRIPVTHTHTRARTHARGGPTGRPAQRVTVSGLEALPGPIVYTRGNQRATGQSHNQSEAVAPCCVCVLAPGSHVVVCTAPTAPTAHISKMARTGTGMGTDGGGRCARVPWYPCRCGSREGHAASVERLGVEPGVRHSSDLPVPSTVPRRGVEWLSQELDTVVTCYCS